MSTLLKQLYIKYNIDSLGYGVKTDKLGDLYEEYICEIFKNKSMVLEYLSTDELEGRIITSIFNKFNIDINKIDRISSTMDIPKRPSGGSSKTDVLITFVKIDGTVSKLPLSVKQSSVAKVAFAEFDVNTICSEVGITNTRLIELMLKHQSDASAKHFTPTEKQELTSLLAPYANSFVRWIVTMTSNSTVVGDVYPLGIIKFGVDSTGYLTSCHIFNIDEYITYIRYDARGNLKKSGFGTGLSWTYATGTKGRKIQFKG